jgi:hypothetical protein
LDFVSGSGNKIRIPDKIVKNCQNFQILENDIVMI